MIVDIIILVHQTRTESYSSLCTENYQKKADTFLFALSRTVKETISFTILFVGGGVHARIFSKKNELKQEIAQNHPGVIFSFFEKEDSIRVLYMFTCLAHKMNLK